MTTKPKRRVKHIFNSEDLVVAAMGSYSHSWDGPKWNAPYRNEIRHKTMPNLVLHACHHRHRTRDAAERCGRKMLMQIDREFVVVAYEEGTKNGLQLVHKTTQINVGDAI